MKVIGKSGRNLWHRVGQNSSSDNKGIIIYIKNEQIELCHKNLFWERPC